MRQTLPIQRALGYLKRGLTSSLWQEGQRLPPVRRLARSARVATAAMQTAVMEMAQKGLLAIERRKGTYAGKRILDLPIPTRSPQRWEAIRQSLRHDTRMGIFEDQEILPSIRQLQKQYAVSPKTLRKAVKAMVSEGELTIDKKKYRIMRIKRSGQFTRILLISPGDTLTRVKIYSGKFNKFYQALEGRCIRSNLRLECCGANSASQNEVLKYLDKNQDYFGYCLYASGLKPGLRDNILHKLALRGRPIAIVDEGDLQKMPHLKYPCTLFSAAAFQAGRQVGQFLQELGHKRIAFITRYHQEAWSQKRYAGLVQAFSETGAQDCVRLVAISDMVSTTVTDIPVIMRTIEKITGINNNFPLRRSIATTEEFAQMIPLVQGLLYLNSQYPVVWKHLADLFKDPSITAVVASQDFMAVLTHEYLKQKNVAVPEKISLCGFDNHEMALEDDLTSYNFLFSNIAADVLAYIINPTAPPFAGKREIECSGAIIQRSTTGKARP
jgi:DNA-binding LacI/PurR family transcriptional regulator